MVCKNYTDFLKKRGGGIYYGIPGMLNLSMNSFFLKRRFECRERYRDSEKTQCLQYIYVKSVSHLDIKWNSLWKITDDQNKKSVAMSTSSQRANRICKGVSNFIQPKPLAWLADTRPRKGLFFVFPFWQQRKNVHKRLRIVLLFFFCLRFGTCKFA